MTRAQTYIEYFHYSGFWRTEETSYKEAMCGLPLYVYFVHLSRNYYITSLKRI